MLTEDELIEQFEACTLPPSAFPHREHVRLAWAYLRREPLTGAIAKFCGGLKAFAASIGKAGLYHETVSWAFMLIIQDRIARGGGSDRWEEFAAANEDLLRNGRQLLERYYLPVTLDSPLARAAFIWPDRPSPDRPSPEAPSDRYRA